MLISDLNQKAFKTLFETLGYSDTIRFLRQYRDGSDNSLAQKDANSQDQSVDEIYTAIKAKSN